VRQVGICLSILFLAVSFLTGSVWAAENKDKPARGLTMAMVYPGVVFGPEDKLKVDLLVKNTGRSDETVFFEIVEKPEGWDAQIKTYSNVVTGVFLSEDQERTLTFSAEPAGGKERLPAGQYHFAVKARTADEAMTRTATVDVTVLYEQKSQGVLKVNTSYPVLRGPSDSKFEFSLDVNNESDEDAMVNLSAKAPEGWEVSFKPAYEEKQISSLQIKANQSKTVGVEVTPPLRAEAGEYPFTVRVQTSQAKADVDLQVVLTGTYKLKMGTLDGLLSLSAQPGKKANMSLYVRNEGSAPQREISFLSFKPENWKVEFLPEKLQEVKAGEVKQIEVAITPADESIIGDYSVAVSAQGEKSNNDVELRVTVKASSTWGWIGVAIILLVIIGLAVTFKKYGRR